MESKSLLQPKEAGNLKRVMEFWMLNRAFHDAYLADPDRALKESGLEVDPEAAGQLLCDDPIGAFLRINRDDAWIPENSVDSEEKPGLRSDQKEESVRERFAPKDPLFRDWRKRQQLRCLRELGRQGQFLAHIPVAYELSSGCSVGCPFCALSAGKLKAVFRHTPENAELWRDVLRQMHALLGDAAGMGMCYYATEPLDNPDYELFLQDYFDEFGRVPQTTTAAATRDIERTRRLITWGQAVYPHFDRISVLSQDMLDTLFSAFAPEELLHTILLPQFREAPMSRLAWAGRNLPAAQGRGSTIACVSGFVINMAERNVRLVTPVASDPEHPTGERIYEARSFSDGAELEDEIRQMIDRHMQRPISIRDLFRNPHS